MFCSSCACMLGKLVERINTLKHEEAYLILIVLIHFLEQE